MCKAIEVGGGFALRQWNLWNKTRMAVSEGIMKTKTTLERWGSGVGGGGAGRKRVKRGEIGQQFTALTNWHAPHWDRVILNRVTCALTLGTRITLYYFVLLCIILYYFVLLCITLYYFVILCIPHLLANTICIFLYTRYPLLVSLSICSLIQLLWHSEDRASWYILIIIPTRCTNFLNLVLE